MICTTCGRRDDDPYRRYDKHGHVIEGCVDECHTGRIFPEISESARWHAARKEATELRQAADLLLKMGSYGTAEHGLTTLREQCRELATHAEIATTSLATIQRILADMAKSDTPADGQGGRGE